MLSRVLSGVAGGIRRSARQSESEFLWHYVLNGVPAAAYLLGREPLAGEMARVAAALKRDGIAVSSVEALGLDALLFNELTLGVEAIERTRSGEMALARQEAHHPTGRVRKPFLFPLVDEPRVQTISDVYARFAFQEKFVAIVNAYLGLHSCLHDYAVWRTFATPHRPTQSQLWHRDPEDRHIVKAFVHLSDVDDGCGPFVYARRTHRMGGLREAPEHIHKDGDTPRSDDGQIAAIVPPADWVTCTGPRGTIVLADTRGYHKGGLARDRDRLVFHCCFVSPGSGLGGVSTRHHGRE